MWKFRLFVVMFIAITYGMVFYYEFRGEMWDHREKFRIKREANLDVHTIKEKLQHTLNLDSIAFKPYEEKIYVWSKHVCYYPKQTCRLDSCIVGNHFVFGHIYLDENSILINLGAYEGIENSLWDNFRSEDFHLIDELLISYRFEKLLKKEFDDVETHRATLIGVTCVKFLFYYQFVFYILFIVIYIIMKRKKKLSRNLMCNKSKNQH